MLERRFGILAAPLGPLAQRPRLDAARPQLLRAQSHLLAQSLA
jgi:hypothetical protein